MTLGQESWPAMRKAITAALEGDLIRELIAERKGRFRSNLLGPPAAECHRTHPTHSLS
jgi:hypothetical protein